MFGIAVLTAAGLAAWPDQARMLVAGPMTHGHETLACGQCHRQAPGSMRQQIQANVAHWVGLRETAAAFGHQPVDANMCRSCHVRDNDRHPSFRFREPRFAKVNKTFDARNCLTCHVEHVGRRVANDGVFCVNCHDGMKARHEKVTPTHADLATHGRWTTCLTCHDFHGNHGVKAPVSLDEAHNLRVIRAYLADGPDPYAPTKIHKALNLKQAAAP